MAVLNGPSCRRFSQPPLPASDPVPGSTWSSLDLVRSFLDFIADVRAKVGAPWLPVYSCFDATKDRTVADRLVEMGRMATTTARGPGAIRLRLSWFGRQQQMPKGRAHGLALY
jgi:hypothetical protein